MFYKSVDGKSSREACLLRDEFERIQMIERERKQNPKIQPKDFYNRSALKSITIAIAMVWLFQSTGFYIIVNYASLIFKISGTALRTEISTIVLCSAQILGGLVATRLGDTFGRKTTLIISLFGSAIGLSTFAVHSYLRQNEYDVSQYKWVPEACLSFAIFISSAGICALANTFVVENFPTKVTFIWHCWFYLICFNPVDSINSQWNTFYNIISCFCLQSNCVKHISVRQKFLTQISSPFQIRSIGMTFYSMTINIVALMGEKFFPLAIEAYQLHAVLLFLAINCCIGTIFVTFMKETKGKSLNALW